VDNGSTDATAEVARRFRSDRFDLQVVDEPSAGINFARNRGVEAARDGLVLLCDADDEVSSGWVHAMTNAFAPGTWVAGVVDYVGLNSPRTRRQWGAPERSACTTPDPFVDRTFGCNCGFSRSMWEEIGRFDDRLSGIGGDETEFFMRAYAAGFRQVWVEEAIVGYRLRPGVRNMCRQRYRQGRNQVRMSRLAGGRVGRSTSGSRPTTALAKLGVAAPKYALSSTARYQWLGAVSSHLGRLAAHVRRSPR
jgi:glycosyltransferase involved in cell wall biosynthesis